MHVSATYCLYSIHCSAWEFTTGSPNSGDKIEINDDLNTRQLTDDIKKN